MVFMLACSSILTQFLHFCPPFVLTKAPSMPIFGTLGPFWGPLDPHWEHLEVILGLIMAIRPSS